jgi:hypothetical protein
MTAPNTDSEDDALSAYSRTGIVSPMGPLTDPLKTFVDFETAAIFRRKVNEAGTDTSGALRDWVYMIAHGKTFSEMVADAQKVKAQKLFGTGPNADQLKAVQP